MNNQTFLQTLFPDATVSHTIAQHYETYTVKFPNNYYILVHLNNNQISYLKTYEPSNMTNTKIWSDTEDITDPNFNPQRWAKQARKSVAINPQFQIHNE
jgi:hypothetical protein